MKAPEPEPPRSYSIGLVAALGLCAMWELGCRDIGWFVALGTMHFMYQLAIWTNYMNDLDRHEQGPDA